MGSRSFKFFYAILILVQVLFGINFITSKIVVSHITPSYWAFMRFFCSGVILMTYSFIFYRKECGRGYQYYLKAFIFAFLGVAVGQTAFLEGISRTTSVNASILASTIPIFTLLIVIIMRHEVFTWNKGLGILLAFIGVLAIRKVDAFSFSNTTFLGDMLIILGAFSIALFLSLCRQFMLENNKYWITSWMLIFSAFQVLVYSQIVGVKLVTPDVWNIELLFCMSYAIIGATILTYLLSNWALAYVDSEKVALFIYLQPIIANILAWTYLGEAVTLQSIISCLLIMLGLFLALKVNRQNHIKN
ncbi:MAG: DMT family transporter [Bacteriovoracaceae bacterium]|nr:DMT family transporter [Bacteriovoracaceae bacterium]